MNNGAKQASLGCNRASLPPQHSLFCHTTQPLLPYYSGCIGRQKRLFLYIMRSTSKQNPTKTAKQISKTDFYFVTCFYSLDNICIVNRKTYFLIRIVEMIKLNASFFGLYELYRQESKNIQLYVTFLTIKS